MAAQALIAEYEGLALRIFGVPPGNLAILHRLRSLFLEAEMRKKAWRHRASPYQLENPKELVTKGANALTPFMISLERLARAAFLEGYVERNPATIQRAPQNWGAPLVQPAL